MIPNRTPLGRFLKGTHWRPRRPYWDREWLRVEYEEKKRSAAEIGADFGVGDTAIQFWLKKHGIATRTTAEVRAVKHWGSIGDSNPMFGRRGIDNPNWRGGLTPYRQQLYQRSEWRSVARKVRRRDKVCCLCQSAKETEIHHIDPFWDAPLLALEETNLILLCAECHKRMRGREKWWRKRLTALVSEGAI